MRWMHKSVQEHPHRVALHSVSQEHTGAQPRCYGLDFMSSGAATSSPQQDVCLHCRQVPSFCRIPTLPASPLPLLTGACHFPASSYSFYSFIIHLRFFHPFLSIRIPVCVLNHKNNFSVLFYLLRGKKRKKKKTKGSVMTPVFLCVALCLPAAPSFLKTWVKVSCVSFSSPTIKVSPGSLEADGYSLRHRAGLGSVRARASERDEPLREGQHVFPDVEDDQQEQWLGEQRPGIHCRHSEGTGMHPLCFPLEMLCVPPCLLSCCFQLRGTHLHPGSDRAWNQFLKAHCTGTEDWDFSGLWH